MLTLFAGEIREGRLPCGYEGGYRDFRFIEHDISNYWQLKKTMPESELKAIRDDFQQNLQQELLAEIGALVRQENLSPVERIWNVQIITPMKNTALRTIALNSCLQKALNPAPKDKAEIRGFLL